MPLEKNVNFLTEALRALRVENCELLYEEERRGLTRFAQDRIHQSSETEGRWLTVRCVEEGRVGLSKTRCFDREALARAAKQAKELAQSLPTPEYPRSLPSAYAGSFQGANDEATAHIQPFERAQIVRNLLDGKGKSKAELSGALVTRRETMCVVSTAGVRVFEERTRVDVNLVATGSGGTGRGFWTGWRISDAPWRRLLDEALAGATSRQETRTELRGNQRVVLDYLAVGQMIGFLGYLGFGAKSFIEKRSFLVSQLGEMIASPQLTVLEDPLSVVPVAHDYEGMPRKRTVLIQEGVACGLVTDSFTATLMGRENTGHAAQPDSPEGPLPTNMVVREGQLSLEELLNLVDEGIYIRDLHYVNVVEPMSTTITGMTRHGTYLIRGGKLTQRLPDFRFQVKILDFLRALIGIGRERRPAEGPCGIVESPPLASECFRIVGAAEQDQKRRRQ